MLSAMLTSASASAYDRKIVLRAGTYVIGMPCEISLALRPLGTAMSLVSAEPPNTRRSMSTITWRSTPARFAMACAAAISTSWRCPYRKLSAMMSKPSPRAIASTVAESRPPLRSTTAVRVTDARSLHGGAVAGHHLLRHPSRENLRSLWHHVGRDPLELVRVVEHQLAGRYVYELTAEYPDQVAGLADLAHH